MSTIILGLGKTGLSCARFLNAQKESFSVMDTRENPPGLEAFKAEFPHVPIYLGIFDAGILQSAKTLIVSPGISLKDPAILQAQQKGATIIGDIELFARHAKAPIIAITGSNAKSTVTTLVGYLLKHIGFNVAVGGNLGVPALDLLNVHPVDYFVLEISSFQLETTTSLTPKVATILNISPDHMDRYATLKDYITAKQRIYNHSDFQVVNRQDQNTYPQKPSHMISFGKDMPQENEFGLANESLYFGKTRLIPIHDLLIKGQHNALNALAALAICHALGISIETLLPALKTFRGLMHRCEFVLERNQVSWYNDSKGTNVGATIAAIEGLGSSIRGKLIWIAGGIGKNADFSPLKSPVKKYVRKAILIGQDAHIIANTLNNDVEIMRVDNLEKAVQYAKEVACPQDAVLLSPACASFDMFRDFEHRGESFKQFVYANE